MIASRVLYDNTTSHLSSNTVQGAVDELASSLEDKIDVSAIGSASGVASLNENGKVPVSELPSYVDDVINGYLYNGAFYEDSSHTTEITPESGKIYIDVETNKTYRWSGTAYVEISESLALGETSSTAYAGNKGKANADAIAAIKDGSTIDSFSDVETALSSKQDKTDNALTTIDKTVVGSINEVNDKADDLSDVVSGETKTIDYTSVITLDDAIPVNADVTAKIEPIQDLHEYDKPWVGGAGKNQLPLVLTTIKSSNTEGTWSGNTYTYKNVSFTVNTDDDGNVTGINVDTSGASDQVEFKLNTGTYKSNTFGGMLINGCSDGNSSTYAVFIAYSNNGTSWASEAWQYSSDVTISSSYSYIRVSILVKSGASVSNKVVYPMLRLSTVTDASFAPYTNICPISGRTQVMVSRTSDNLVIANEIKDNTWLDGDDGHEADSLGGYVTGYIPFVAGQSIHIPATGTARRFLYDKNKNAKVYLNNKDEQVCTPDFDGYLRVSALYATINSDELKIEYGTTATPFSKQGESYTISLNGTRYGGTLHIDNKGNAELLVDRAYVEFNGDGGEKWSITQTNMKQTSVLKSTAKYPATNNTVANIMCDKYKAITANNCYTGTIGVAIDIEGYLGINPGYSMTVSEWQAVLSNAPLQVVYELANPFTVSLSPAQIQLLKGKNTIYADSGDIKLIYETGLEESISDVQEQVNDVQSGFTDAIGWDRNVNIFNKSTAVYNKTVGSDGAEKADTGYFCSDYIPITPNTTYYLTKVFGVNWANAGCTYDSTKTFIRKFTISDPSGAASSGAYTVSDSNAAFMRINGDLTKIGEVQVEKGSSATAFEPYHPVIGSSVETLLSRVPAPPTGKHAFEHYLCADGTWTEALPPIRVGSSGTSGDYSSTYYYTKFGFVTMLWVEGIINKWDYDQVITICSPGFVPMGAVEVVYGVGVYDGDNPPTPDNVAHFYMENGDVKIYCEKEMHYGRAFFMFIDTTMS